MKFKRLLIIIVLFLAVLLISNTAIAYTFSNNIINIDGGYDASTELAPLITIYNHPFSKLLEVLLIFIPLVMNLFYLVLNYNYLNKKQEGISFKKCFVLYLKSSIICFILTLIYATILLYFTFYHLKSIVAFYAFAFVLLLIIEFININMLRIIYNRVINNKCSIKVLIINKIIEFVLLILIICLIYRFIADTYIPINILRKIIYFFDLNKSMI